jgi:hypothetical protein
MRRTLGYFIEHKFRGRYPVARLIEQRGGDAKALAAFTPCRMSAFGPKQTKVDFGRRRFVRF